MHATHTLGQIGAKEIPADKLPGHWLLASLGKRVLRPGGRGLTKKMLAALAISPADRVVEFAPGLGETAAQVLRAGPAAYTGIERDMAAVAALQKRFAFTKATFRGGSAENTGLPDACASVVWGEAMLSMHPPSVKERVIREAARILTPQGLYAIHELALSSDTSSTLRCEIEAEMSRQVHVGVRPLTTAEWRNLLDYCGFRVVNEIHAPMHLLEPARMISDEGFCGMLRIVLNALRKPEARCRMMSMRRLFRKHKDRLSAVALICAKK